MSAQHPLLQVTLNCGAQMPSVGFGTAGLGSQTVPAVHAALQAGYTLLDTAQVLFGSSKAIYAYRALRAFHQMELQSAAFDR